VSTAPARTIDWSDAPSVVLLDQTVLPHQERYLRARTVGELIDAVQRLAVRGAPALGVAGALGVALAAYTSANIEADIRALRAARPTAVNLARGVDRAAARLGEGPAAVLAEALAVRDEDIASCASMAAYGADLLTELAGADPRLLTHCNTGALACVTGGTALGVVIELHRRGRLAAVIASETRPLLQSARLTAWELGRAGVPYRIAVDGAGPSLMARGLVDAVIVGADRVCANGDVVNKIGTYAHALGAARARIPFVVVAPESTVDMATPCGAEVEIEERSPDEVTALRHSPLGAASVNPAFDVTPADLVTALVTDRRVVRLPAGGTLAAHPPGPLRDQR
jgi:S-methyl-5-thioribose-1-phosphate isomerase